MPYRTPPFITGNIYHIYNRGLAKQPIFHSDADRYLFIETFLYYQLKGPKPKFSVFRRLKNKIFPETKKIINLLAYCLMPNHIHFLVVQTEENGINEFMRKFIHSYSKYRNTKYNRLGPTFQAMFKSVLIETDEQLIHVSRYIHLNPVVAGLVDKANQYHWSSYCEYVATDNRHIVDSSIVLDLFGSLKQYKEFVDDHQDYAVTLRSVKHLLLEK